MSEHQSAYDDSQGSPNLEVLQYLQENWGSTEIAAAARITKASLTVSGGNIAVTIPVGAKIIDAHVIAKATSGGGTVQVSTGATVPVAITDAMTCATDGALARATEIDYDNNVVGADGIVIVPNNDTDVGDVYITYLK